MLATIATLAGGVLTISLPAANDDATISLPGPNYEVRDQANAVVAIAGGPANPGNVTKLVVIASGLDLNNDFVLNAPINPINGIDITDGGDVDTVTTTSNGVITGVGVGQQVNIQSPSITLSANISTEGGNVVFNGPVTLAGNVVIDTDIAGALRTMLEM